MTESKTETIRQKKQQIDELMADKEREKTYNHITFDISCEFVIEPIFVRLISLSHISTHTHTLILIQLYIFHDYLLRIIILRTKQNEQKKKKPM